MMTLVVEIYEPGRSFPTVEHRFNGASKAEAFSYYRAHLMSDRYLRSCTFRGYFGSPYYGGGYGAYGGYNGGGYTGGGGPCNTKARWIDQSTGEETPFDYPQPIGYPQPIAYPQPINPPFLFVPPPPAAPSGGITVTASSGPR